MMEMRCLAACLALVPLASAAVADDAKTTFKAGARIPANIGFASTLSEDKQVATTIFDNAVVALNPTARAGQHVSGQTASQAKVITLEFPYETDRSSVAMTLDVRGFAMMDPDACLKLVVHAGNQTRVVPIIAAPAKPGDEKVALKGKAKEAHLASTPEIEGYSGDFSDRIEFNAKVHAEKPVCQVTLVLLAEHDTDRANSGGGLLVVDSLDLSFADAAEGKHRP